jgi:hypothetical protein
MPTIRVPQKYAVALEAGLEEFETRTGLKRTSVERVQTGGKDIADVTKRYYGKHYDGLYQFAAMIGAYGPCFALSYYAPICPSADDDVIALYIMYKTEPKGTIIVRNISRQRKFWISFKSRSCAEGTARIPVIAISSCLQLDVCMDHKATEDNVIDPVNVALGPGKNKNRVVFGIQTHTVFGRKEIQEQASQCKTHTWCKKINW